MPQVTKMFHEDFQKLRLGATAVAAMCELVALIVLVLSAVALHERHQIVDYLMEIFRNVDTECDLRHCLVNFVVVTAAVCYSFAVMDILVNSMLLIGIIRVGDIQWNKGGVNLNAIGFEYSATYSPICTECRNCCLLILPWLIYHGILLVLASFIISYLIVSFMFIGFNYFIIGSVIAGFGLVICVRLYQVVFELFKVLDKLAYDPPPMHVEVGVYPPIVTGNANSCIYTIEMAKN